jgi:zinc transport system permease protein
MEMLSYGFMQKAFLAGILLGLLSALVGFFVVLKRLSFIGAGIAHTAFGGVALGLVTGLNPLWTAGAFALGVAWLIAWISRQGRLPEDTAIGIFFAGAMALGVGILSLSKGYYGDVFGYLFGNILAVSTGDLALLFIAGTGVAVFILLSFRALLFLCFDEELAAASGLPVRFLYYGLFTAIALTVMVAAKMVGIVLASALLVTPAATGYQLARTYRGMLAVSVLAGLFSSLAGLWLSFIFNLASGAAIVLCATLFFLISFCFSPRRRRISRWKEQEKPAASENKLTCNEDKMISDEL